ncbi:MAG: pyridoxal phosphate-dependent aminotransferase [Acidobacteria bacterium]|nr:pyridoxal phosphate-dependent aminotransferase [Acidobacteriota bacterium]MCA1651583.1 pyridoxal phosphate-dependent aminotransferase [Acidobacteriota bacterium]
MRMLAPRAGRIGVSPTMKVAAEALKLKAQGVDVVDLGAGEPDFPTPVHVSQAAHAAIDANFTKYTTNSGTEDLRQAVADRYRADYGVEYSTKEIIISAGGKQGLYNAAMVLFSAGDEVITHMPGWPTLVEQIRLADATPIIVRTHAEDGFSLRAAPLLSAITPRTRGIMVNSPGNPTGALISERDLAAVADEAARRGIWILLDLCYEKLIYDPTPHNLPRVLTERMRDRTVLCGSASKAYAMTGWRCGWTLAPAEVVNACNALQSHSTSNVCSITQKAVLAAVSGPQQCVTDMLDEYRRRRDLMCQLLADEPRLRVLKPAGAFYLFLDVSEFLSPDGVRTSAQLAQCLLDDVRVAITPGEAFDAPGFIRVSYATSTEQLERGASRIIDYVRALERRAAIAR